MAKLTLDDLRKLRDEKQKAIEKRDPSNKDAQIITGMGTPAASPPVRKRRSTRLSMDSTPKHFACAGPSNRLHGIVSLGTHCGGSSSPTCPR